MTRHITTLLGRRRRLVALVAVPALVAGAVTARASWTTHGSGTGAATAAGMQTVTLVAFVGGDAPSSTLVPGGTADVILRVSNPNPFSVQVYSISSAGAITPDASHPGCTTTGVSFTPPASPSITIPAGPSSTLVHLAGAAAMSASSSSGCQGATFSIPITLVVHR